MQATVPNTVPEVGRPAPSLVEVDAATRAELAALAATVTADPVTHADWFCRQARAASRRVPAELAETLLTFSDAGSDSGILVVRGLETGPVPPTPLDNTGAVGARTLLARQLAVLGHLLGEMISYEAEGHGHLLQDMCPNPTLAATQQSQGSRVVLEAHTEQCFSPLRPDHVLLGCLRGDPAAATHVFSARDLLGHLTPAEADLLRQPLWTTRIDSSFAPHVPDPEEVRGPFPVLTDGDDPALLVDQDLMRGITEEAQALLEKVIAVYCAHHRAHVLVPGDVLLLDNVRAMHGRSSFTPRFDGTDRFVVRGFAVRDLRRSAAARQPGSRQVAASAS